MLSVEFIEKVLVIFVDIISLVDYILVTFDDTISVTLVISLHVITETTTLLFKCFLFSQTYALRSKL